MDEITEIEVAKIEKRIDRWVRQFVVALEICPFAQHVIDNESVRYKVSTATSELDLMADLEAELHLLQDNPDLSTSLLITSSLLKEFNDYLDFLETAEQLLQDSHLAGVFQLASFHPNYQFEDTAPDALENFSNRSPYPVIHILRESQVDLAVSSYGDTSAIPTRNISLLQQLSEDELSQHMKP